MKLDKIAVGYVRHKNRHASQHVKVFQIIMGCMVLITITVNQSVMIFAVINTIARVMRNLRMSSAA